MFSNNIMKGNMYLTNISNNISIFRWGGGGVPLMHTFFLPAGLQNKMVKNTAVLVSKKYFGVKNSNEIAVLGAGLYMGSG